jgi:HlyD family secretion protein
MTKAQPAPDDWSSAVRTDLGDLVGTAGKSMVCIISLFVGWAFLVPIESAVNAPGIFVSSGKNQTLQHRDGGRIRSIIAHEGDLVDAGSVILELDPTLDQARLTKLTARNAVLSAQKQRLEAEKMGAEKGKGAQVGADFTLRGIDPTETAAVSGAGFSDVEQIGLQGSLDKEQYRELQSGRNAVNAQVSGLQSRVEGLNSQIKGLEDRRGLLQQQISIISSQRDSAHKLVKSGDLARQTAWELDAQYLGKQSELSDVSAQMLSLGSSVQEAKRQMDEVLMGDAKQTSEKLTDVLAEMGAIEGELAAAKESRLQTVIRAPTSGYLLHFKVNTIGEVIAPGTTIGEIVPDAGQLEVQARVSTKDIETVHIGELAKVKIAALNPRVYDAMGARVTFVAADASQDERTGERYFEVRAKLDETVADKPLTEIRPGMTADVALIGDSRTFVTYLLQPLTDSLSHSFREAH